MTGERYVIEVPGHKLKERLDAFLARELPKLSRNKIQKLIKDKAVTIDGKGVKANHMVHASEIIEVVIPKTPPRDILPEKIPLDIVFEDEYLLVVNKKAGQGMLCHRQNCGGSLLGRHRRVTVKHNQCSKIV